MPFGKYQGFELTEIPLPYLRWLREQKWVGGWLLHGIDGVLGDKAGWTQDDKEAEEIAAFMVYDSGGIGQSIVNCDGGTVAWMTDDWVARVICKLLNENEGLFYKKEKDNETHA